MFFAKKRAYRKEQARIKRLYLNEKNPYVCPACGYLVVRIMSEIRMSTWMGEERVYREEDIPCPNCGRMNRYRG